MLLVTHFLDTRDNVEKNQKLYKLAGFLLRQLHDNNYYYQELIIERLLLLSMMQ